MCNACMMEGFDCGVLGDDCCDPQDEEFYGDIEDVPYQTPVGGYSNLTEPGTIVTKEMIENMTTKTEVEIEDMKSNDNGTSDGNGIITKQSEVYVWNDQVFASYKSALAASKKDKIYKALIEGYAAKHYPNYSKAQVTSLVNSWSKVPASYSISLDVCFEAFTKLLAE